ncbi:MAG: hypothetical protein H6510_13210 [Acidobacteria bacterium]|nr:hypothetical protein [Acidobacteriota bacterium]MCB9398766.1 hypothetical protein [Acidobacteriota bacterium]
MAKPNKNTKIRVMDREGQEFPFLRGILTRSLQEVGLDFNQAYSIATRVREDLGGANEVSTEHLRRVIAQRLKLEELEVAHTRYQARAMGTPPILVSDFSGHASPFSKGELARSMELCAFGSDKSYAICAHIEKTILARKERQITSNQLAKLVYEHLLQNEPPEVAQRYITWIALARSGRPLVLLIGGTTGSGKSTISAELAHRLSIVRTQSTDMLREIMRLLIPERLLPTLHTSSFSAWEALSELNPSAGDGLSNLIEGYLTQSSHVGIGIEGVLQRAERERISLIVEGVHIHPQMMAKTEIAGDTIVIPLLLAVLKRKNLKKQLVGRGQTANSRRAERYLTHFESICKVQNFLLAEADRYGVPIIGNDDQEKTLKLIMDTIAETLGRFIKPNPELLFHQEKKGIS